MMFKLAVAAFFLAVLAALASKIGAAWFLLGLSVLVLVL